MKPKKHPLPAEWALLEACQRARLPTSSARLAAEDPAAWPTLVLAATLIEQHGQPPAPEEDEPVCRYLEVARREAAYWAQHHWREPYSPEYVAGKHDESILIKALHATAEPIGLAVEAAAPVLAWAQAVLAHCDGPEDDELIGDDETPGGLIRAGDIREASRVHIRAIEFLAAGVIHSDEI